MTATFSTDGRTLATTSFDGLVKLWSTSDWRELAALSGQLTSFSCVAFSPDDRRLAAGGEGGIRLWDISHAQPLEVGTLRIPGQNVVDMTFHTDGDSLVSVDSGAIRLWRAPR